MRDLRLYPTQPHSELASHETVFTVAEYISLINTSINQLKATIQGEIGKITYSTKAVYFSLYDKNRSVINCMIWLSRLQSLGVDLQDGSEVKIQGSPDVWSGNGKLTFKVNAIIPIGEGALKLAFERLKADLEKEGYFRRERKQTLPPYVSKIGLITSQNGVVIRDFSTGLGNHGLKVYFHDVRVEGINAIENIVTAIQWFNENTSDIQVLVIARGGGSLEQLQPFNTLEIAKAIHGSKIPVMTAIGHETDVTIADLVADVRASVPMDAGQRLATPWIQASKRIDTIEHNTFSAFKSACRELEQKLHAFGESAVSSYANRLTDSRKHIDFYQSNLTRCFRDMLLRIESIEGNFKHNYERYALRLSHSKKTVNALHFQLDRETQRYMDGAATTLANIEGQFANNFTRLQRYIKSLNEDVATQDRHIQREAKRWYLAIAKWITDCETMLLACDPSQKLKQGFSIVTDKHGNVIKSSKSVKASDIVGVQLFEGTLKTKVEEVK